MMRSVALICAILIAGCANWDARRATMQQQFYGKHIDVAIRTLGVPTGKANLSDGGQVVEFVTYRGNFRCEDKFITNAQGIVVSGEHGGQNGCAMPF